MLSFECAVMNGENEIIFPVWDYDMIYRLNLNNGESRCLEGYVPEGVFNGPKYGAVCKYKNSLLIFAPSYSERVYIYDLGNNHGRYIELTTNKEKQYLFFDSFVYGDFVYLLPGRYGAIVKINLITDEVIYYEEIIDEVKKLREDKGLYFRHGCAVVGNYAYAPCHRTGTVVRINLTDDEFEMININNDRYKFTSMCVNDNEVFALDVTGRLIRINFDEGEAQEVFSPEYMTEREAPYLDVCSCGNSIVELPRQMEFIHILNKSDEIYYDEKLYCGRIRCFGATTSGKYVYAYSYEYKQVFQISPERGEIVKKFALKPAKDEKMEFELRHYSHQSDLFVERDYKSLNGYIDHLLISSSEN